MQPRLRPLFDAANFISCEFKTDKPFKAAGGTTSTNAGFFIEIPKEDLSYTTQISYIRQAHNILQDIANKLWEEQQVKINWDSVVFRYCF